MTTTAEAVRSITSEYLAGRIALEVLDGVIANVAESPNLNEPELHDLWGRIELLLAELSSGQLEETEFRAELAKLVPINLSIGSGTVTVRQITSTSARLFTNPTGGLFQEAPTPDASRSDEAVPA